MKLTNNLIYKEFNFNRFFFDDIMKIYYVLKNEYNQINIIVNDNRIIHNIKDLKNNNIKSIKFNINENNDFLLIELNENETIFNSHTDTVKIRGIFSFIKDLLSTTEKKHNFLYNDFVLIIFHLIIWILILRNVGGFINNQITENFIVIFAIVSFFIYLYHNFLPEIKNKNIFTLNINREDYNFYKEYKGWIVSIVSGLILEVITSIFKN